MEYRSLGKSSLKASVIGLGCMCMSEFYGETNEEEAAATLKRAVELGINHFDTADMYGIGHNEKLVGKILKPYRDKIIIATKFGIVRDKNNPASRGINGTPEYVKKACDASLKRLGMETIDLYYLHRTDPKVEIEETVGAMAQLVKEGKVRYLGLSEVNPDIIRRAYRIHPIAALQSEYSLWNREPENELIPLCEELGIAFVAYSPLGRGFLTGSIKNVEILAANDFRRTMPRFQPENLEHNLKIVHFIENMAKKKNCKPGQLALAWLLGQSPNIVVIPGTKRRIYLEENAASVNVDLTEKERDELGQLIPLGFAKGERYPKMVFQEYGRKEQV